MNRTKITVHPASISLLTDASWEFALQQLWNGYPFSKAEKEAVKTYIKSYYKDILPELFYEYAGKHFNAFCQRILMAKRYVSRFPSRYIPHPIIYFNPSNLKGFKGTLRWYQEDQEKERVKNTRFYLINGELFVTRVIYNNRKSV